MPDKSWIQGYKLIKDTWGVAPIYLGRQRPNKGADQRTTANAVKDANEAASLAEEAGIPSGHVIYLDIEDGGLQSPTSVDYFNAWVDRLRTCGFAPGVYCSYLALDQLLTGRPNVMPWVYKLTIKSGQVVGPQFENDAGAPLAPYQTARMQQYAQNCRVKTGVSKGSLLIGVASLIRNCRPNCSRIEWDRIKTPVDSNTDNILSAVPKLPFVNSTFFLLMPLFPRARWARV